MNNGGGEKHPSYNTTTANNDPGPPAELARALLP